MQRDRARERNERARRQWELEHADMQQVPPGSGPPGMTPSGSATPRNNGPTTLNHIGSSDTIDGIPGFSLVMSHSDRIVAFKDLSSKVNEKKGIIVISIVQKCHLIYNDVMGVDLLNDLIEL